MKLAVVQVIWSILFIWAIPLHAQETAGQDRLELPARGDTRIAVVSDINSGLGADHYEWQVDSIMARIPRIWQPDLVISGGDLVAGMGVSDTTVLDRMWQGFHTYIAKPLKEADIPFAFTMGNHDGPRSYPIERVFAADFWNKPENKPNLDYVDDEFFPMYYSFVKDDLFFVSWEASSPVITEENLEWMENQFATSEAKNAKMRFVMGHMPLYSNAQERDSRGNVLENPERLQRLLEEYEVHTYISGHQHAYYPAKRGGLELLNSGAAGSGPRSWLTIEKRPVNTITIMDIFHEQDTIVYSTYDIKERAAENMRLFPEESLPSAMFGVNGHMLRRDIRLSGEAEGKFSPFNLPGDISSTGSGTVKARIDQDHLVITGSISIAEEQTVNTVAALHKGRNTEEGEFIAELDIAQDGTIEGEVEITPNTRDYLSVGALYIVVTTEGHPEGVMRTQLYPRHNQAPMPPEISSHEEDAVYDVRDIPALYEIAWDEVVDKDGDFVSYIYQLSADAEFEDLLYQKNTGRASSLKIIEEELYGMLPDVPEGNHQSFYQRILATDGRNMVEGPPTILNLIASEEPVEGYIEVQAPAYHFKGKIAGGAGYGVEWDHDGKLWLADYSGALIILDAAGEEATFSPLRSVEVNGEEYDLSPVNGIGVDTDGHILAGINRYLYKIDAKTGEGIARWEAPEGNRAITSPRATESGEIYASSLFGDDPVFVLRQNEDDPSGFDLVRTIHLEGRILSRTFDMSADGKTLFFPDPGSPVVQKFVSEDGFTYSKAATITSTAAGSSAIHAVDEHTIFTAVRSSGIVPSTFHYRNEEEKVVWTLELPELNLAEPRGIGVSADHTILIFASFDQGGGYFIYELKE